MIFASIIVHSLLYAIPLIPFFIVCWIFQARVQRRIDCGSGQKTGCVAEQVARRILDHAQLQEIKIEKSENFTENQYDVDKNKVMLSPDNIAETDVTSVALAVRAAVSAVFHQQVPRVIQRWNQVKIVENILFWITFTVLSFGLMSGKMPVFVTGYLIGILTLIFHGINVACAKKLNSAALESLRELRLFNSEELENLVRVLNAEAEKY